MDPAQLLNPKAFAKAKARTPKRTPNYGPAHCATLDCTFHPEGRSIPISKRASDKACIGPAQSRKPASTMSSASAPTGSRPSTYNPQLLLNPKATATAFTPDGPAETQTSNGTGDGEVSARSMIERLNAVRNREDEPIPKRKAIVDIDDSDEERSKKAKTSFGMFGSSGVISDHLREERRREQESSQAAAVDMEQHSDERQSEPNRVAAIDLTVDDEDEVQVVKDTGNEEVCLGTLQAMANVYRFPTVSSNGFRALGQGVWPRVKVSCRREPSSNMVIDLLDPAGNKFGNMDAKVASVLCQLMHGVSVNRVRFKTWLKSRPRTPQDDPGKRTSLGWPVEIIFYAPRRLAKSIGAFLGQKNLWLRAPVVNPGKEYVDAQAVPQIKPPKSTIRHLAQGGGHVSRTVEEMRREASSTFDTLAKSAEALPELEPTNDIITTPLMPHQKQALHFMMEHERSDPEGGELLLWKSRVKTNGQETWYHVITGKEMLETPKPVKGGILADVMGLGKTLSILALVMETREAAESFWTENATEIEEIEADAKGTLIICPKSVMANWQEQIDTHTAAGKVRYYAYHGPGRTTDTEVLSEYDIVFTTYNTVAAEFSDANRSKSPLASINWFRIVLDEAHQIRNQSTKLYKSCVNLHAQRRWAVTGTPIQNGLEDLGALVRFLRVKPLDNPRVFAEHMIVPLRTDATSETALQHLQILVSSISLRRTKGTVDLPDRKEVIVELPLSKAEWALYLQFKTRMGTVMGTLVKKDSDVLRGKAYAYVLKGIGRLRAICAHGREMVSEEDMKEIEGYDQHNAIVLDLGDEPDLDNGNDFIAEKQAYETFLMMQDSDAASCYACEKELNQSRSTSAVLVGTDADDDSSDEGSATERDGVLDGHVATDHFANLTPCYHLLCEGCKDAHYAKIGDDMTADRYYSCPHCGQFIRDGMFPLYRSAFRAFLRARDEAARKPRAAKWDEHTYSGPHTKVKELIKDLRQSQEETAGLPPGEPPIRSVVFSGWTSYLDLIEHALMKENIGQLRLDGSMNLKQRREALEQFKSDPSKEVLLISIKAGGQGLNLVAANHVYVMEPQFNPGVERQAVDRVYRMGQTRDVLIKHYFMTSPTGESTIEGGIRKLQEMKEQLARVATDKKKVKGEEARARMQMLQEMFRGKPKLGH